MRNGLARIREGTCDLCRRMDTRNLQMTVTDVHDAMGRMVRNEADIHGSRFGLNSGDLGQDSACEDRDLFVAAATVRGGRRSGRKRGRARSERRGTHALASDHQSGLDTGAPGKGRDRRIGNDGCFA